MEGGLVMVQRFLEQGQCLLAALQLLLRRLLRDDEVVAEGDVGLREARRVRGQLCHADVERLAVGVGVGVRGRG